MAHHLEKDAIIQLAARLFTVRTDLSAVKTITGQSPEMTLAEFVVAVIEDLYSPESPDRANFERMANALIGGATQLEFIAKEFRKRADW